MNPCFNCGHMYADVDESGSPISSEYCHWIGPSEWAPCADSFDIEYEDMQERVKWEMGNETYNKPPLGLTPRHIWEAQRIVDILDAMKRYVQAGERIPCEWNNELNALLNPDFYE